jgi:hypothetical protein
VVVVHFLAVEEGHHYSFPLEDSDEKIRQLKI